MDERPEDAGDLGEGSESDGAALVLECSGVQMRGAGLSERALLAATGRGERDAAASGLVV